MPSYLFKCVDCLHEQSEYFPMGTAPDSIRCYSCGGDARRSYQAPAVFIR